MYLYSGKVSFDINHKTAILNKGDLLVINKPAILNLEISGVENSELVFSEIS
jgi:hypothetical protein